MRRGVTMGAAAALVLAGMAAMASVLAAHRSVSRADGWLQTRATVERAEGRNVTYRYDAGGVAQRGTAVADRIPAAGAPLLVYVNPDDPAESMLQLPPRPALWPAFAGGVALVAGLFVGVYFFMHDRKKQQARPVRRKAPPLSRLRPPPPLKRAAPDTPEP